MKVWTLLFLMTAMLSILSATSEAPLESYAANSSDLVKITHAPLKMDPGVASLCVSAGQLGDLGIHSDKFFDIYISKSGLSTMQSGKGIYPENTVVLKRKYSDASGTKTELYTGMIKRGKGYNRQGGDWEYFVVSGDTKKVLQNGALTSCMQCHQVYANTDFVTRGYMTYPDFYHAADRK